MREVTLDTETTGLLCEKGDKLVEIGCLELVNHIPTGKKFHCHINPQRSMPAAAEAVHGLSEKFLAEKPVFSAIVSDFLNFISDSPLIIHNASFDLGFINKELKDIGLSPIPFGQAIDTVLLARQKFPGAPASLDALCRRFGINNEHRILHGALLDAELLAEIYLELKGGRQPGLVLQEVNSLKTKKPTRPRNTIRAPRTHTLTSEEMAAHARFIESIDDPIWRK